MSFQSSQDRPKKLLEQVENLGWYEFLAAQLVKQKHWQRILADVLDPVLAEKCYILEILNNRLILETDNAIWATRIRFQAPELIKSLKHHAEFQGITSIQCKVRPRHYTHQGNPSRPTPISAESAQAITQIAEGIADSRLKNALMLLARK